MKTFLLLPLIVFILCLTTNSCKTNEKEFMTNDNPEIYESIELLVTKRG